MNTRTFGWDADAGRPLLRLDRDKVGEGIRFTSLGADDEMANTMFALLVDGEREMSRRPEPLLVTYISLIAHAESFTLSLNGKPHRVDFGEDRKEKLERLRDDLEDGLKDAPLGP